MRRMVLNVAALGLTGLGAVFIAAQPAAAALPATQLYYPEVVSPGQSFPVRLHYAKPNGGDLNFDCTTQHATGYLDGRQLASITPTNSGHACDAIFSATVEKSAPAGKHTVRVAVDGGPALSGSMTIQGAATRSAAPAAKPSRTTPKPAAASAAASVPTTSAPDASSSDSPSDSPSATDAAPVTAPSPSIRPLAATGNELHRDERYAAGGVGVAGVLTGLGVVLVRRRSRRAGPAEGIDALP